MSKDDWLFLLFLFLVGIMMIAASGVFFFSYAIYWMTDGIKRFYHKGKKTIVSFFPERDEKAHYRNRIKRQFVNNLEIELSNFNSFIKGIKVSLACSSNENDDLIVTLTDDRFEKEIMRIRIDFERERVSYSYDGIEEHRVNNSNLRHSTLMVLVVVREHLEELFS